MRSCHLAREMAFDQRTQAGDVLGVAADDFLGPFGGPTRIDAGLLQISLIEVQLGKHAQGPSQIVHVLVVGGLLPHQFFLQGQRLFVVFDGGVQFIRGAIVAEQIAKVGDAAGILEFHFEVVGLLVVKLAAEIF